MKELIKKLIECFSKLYKVDNKTITLFFNGYSGSNLSPIIEKIYHGDLNEYKIKVFENNKPIKKSRFQKITSYINKYKQINKSKLIITTHGGMKVKNKTLNLDLWHGFPLKGMNLMDKGEIKKKKIEKLDFICSSSILFNTVMNSCCGLNVENYVITGNPRNDYLFSENGKNNLSILLGEKIFSKKIVMYMPTYRNSNSKGRAEGNKNDKNLFGFKDFSKQKFCDFLAKNDILFLFKLHPNEEKLYLDKYENDNNNTNMRLIKSEELSKNNMDLYKIVNSFDLLITDYSSIYFDYLLLNRPIIFIPIDFREYEKSRGFLLYPYDFWTPGPKCYNQYLLQNEIDKCLSNNDYYEKERKIIKNIVHKYQDGDSTDRVIKLIKKVMKE